MPRPSSIVVGLMVRFSVNYDKKRLKFLSFYFLDIYTNDERNINFKFFLTSFEIKMFTTYYLKLCSLNLNDKDR